MGSAVERFRARFHGVDAGRTTSRRRTPDERLRAALDLHAFNLRLTIDKVRGEMGDADEAAILREVNRRRAARSPVPTPLCRRPR
jgi:hypothetical protein